MSNIIENIISMTKEIESRPGYSPLSEDAIRAIAEIAISGKVNSSYEGYSYVLNFINGYGASIIKHDYSRASSCDDRWELAVLKNNSICYDTDLTDDVICYLTEDDLVKEVINISNLDAAGHLADNSICNELIRQINSLPDVPGYDKLSMDTIHTLAKNATYAKAEIPLVFEGYYYIFRYNDCSIAVSKYKGIVLERPNLWNLSIYHNDSHIIFQDTNVYFSERELLEKLREFPEIYKCITNGMQKDEGDTMSTSADSITRRAKAFEKIQKILKKEDGIVMTANEDYSFISYKLKKKFWKQAYNIVSKAPNDNTQCAAHTILNNIIEYEHCQMQVDALLDWVLRLLDNVDSLIDNGAGIATLLGCQIDANNIRNNLVFEKLAGIRAEIEQLL